MTRDKILSDLFTSKDFTSCIAKMKPENLQDELKAEVALILCEMNEDKLIGLAERKELKFYTVRIILNLIQSKTSPFYIKFRKQGAIYNSANKQTTTYHESYDFTDIEARFLNVNEDDLFKNGIDSHDKIQIALASSSLSDADSYDERPDKALAEIDNLYWYDREILKLYAEHGTFRKIEEVTGIPFESIYKTCTKNFKLIRQKIV